MRYSVGTDLQRSLGSLSFGSGMVAAILQVGLQQPSELSCMHEAQVSRVDASLPAPL